MDRRPLRILLIGPLPPPLGGTTVLFAHLVEDLRARDDVQITVLPTTGIRGAGLQGLKNFFGLCLRVFRTARQVDVVSFHCIATGLNLIGPLVVAAARLADKPLILRKFGGMDISCGSRLSRTLSWWVVSHADLYLAETKALIAAARDRGIGHAAWYANSRKMLPLPPQPPAPRPCRRFLYVGNLRRCKGIMEIIEAAQCLPPGVEVDVYGTLTHDIRQEDFHGQERVRYCGELAPEEAIETIRQYDALLLPSYNPHEGYPGVVLEAYSAGVPVICTRWQAIPEIVDQRTGLLVEPRNAESLRRAMLRLIEDDALVARLRQGVAQRREEFSAELWTDCFIQHCLQLAAQPKTGERRLPRVDVPHPGQAGSLSPPHAAGFRGHTPQTDHAPTASSPPPQSR